MTHLFRSTTSRNTLLIGGGLTFKLAMQALSFAIIAPTLGSANFGLYISFLAIGNVVGPFVDMGTYGLVVRDMNRGITARQAISSNVVLTVLLAPIGLLIFALIAWLTIPDVPIWSGITIAAGMMLGLKMYNLARAIFIGAGTVWKVSVLEVNLALLQLVAALALRCMDGTINIWATLVFTQNALIGLGAVVWLTRLYGFPHPQLSGAPIIARIREGLHFAVSGAAGTLGSEADKMLLPRLAGIESTGLYGAAQRIIAVSAVPITALSTSVYSRYFSAAETGGGYAASRCVANRIALPILAYSATVAAVLWLVAPYALLFFGPSYSGIETAIRLLAVLSIILALQLPFGDALTGSGNQHIRTRYQIGALVLNLLLNLLLVPLIGWLGAVYAALVSQTLFLAALFFHHDGKEDGHGNPTPPRSSDL